MKLLADGVVEEVQEEDIQCVNPLTVASNKKGKKRLCLDLSRHVNESCQAKKFRIESIQDFIKTVKQGSWCWYYDLKSAYHHVSIIEKHRKFLGFKVVIEGKARVFRFVAMPFGYKDASRILTKIMRTPICRWRTMDNVCVLVSGLGGQVQLGGQGRAAQRSERRDGVLGEQVGRVLRTADQAFGRGVRVLCVLRQWGAPDRWQGQQEGHRAGEQEVPGVLGGVGEGAELHLQGAEVY